MKYKKILITGILGSGGYYLAKYIIDNYPELKVYGLARWRSGFDFKKNNLYSNVCMLECDLTDVSSVARAFNEAKPDLVFNMASNANVRASFDTPLAILQNNIFSTANLLEVIRLSDLNPTVVHCSTSEVYGKVSTEDIPITEKAPIKPASPYAVSKTTQDMLCDVYFRSFGMPIIRTRMFGYINPRRDDLFATAFAKQIVQIERGEKSVLEHGNLDSIRTLIDVRDAAESYWETATYCIPGEAYNIGGSTPIKVGECLTELIKLAKKPISTKLNESLLRPNDVTLQIPSSEKFVKETGWKQKISLKESLNFLLEFWRQRSAV
ncbi:MAG: hypothetical protein CBC42_05400 [Betaproteobacteria bacterium TMED82]|nr:MAG: hypothetical protein CBC42_05400 [Betaproteobacteria bacterium TMED82]|tara:strand:- start:139050 stop:140018 length:969 start_codon:yes stop_codon:yes gene_type:complete